MEPRRPGLFLLTALVTVAAALPAWSQTAATRRCTETRLCDFPAAVRKSAILSPTALHVAYIKESADSQVVVHDGKDGESYRQVTPPVFSPNGRRLAYAASKGNQWHVVVDGRESEPFERVGEPLFSPDSRRVAHVVLLPDGNRAVVVDGKPGPAYEGILEGKLVFSPDSKRLAYGARKGNDWFLVVEGQALGPYEYLGTASGYQFSPDSLRLAFAALADKKWSLVLDGKVVGSHENIGPIALGAGTRLAYAAVQEGKWQVTVDGKAQARFDAIGENTLLLSPDSKRIAYAAQSGKTWSVVLDGKAGKGYAKTGQMLFSPDSKRFAYVAKVNDEQGESLGETVVEGDREHYLFDRVGGNTLVFSGSSRHLGYIGRVRQASFAVIDGKRKPRYDMVAYLTFTPDSRTYAYAAVKVALKPPKAFSVVDDKDSDRLFDEIWNPPGVRLLFDSPKKFHYMAIKENQLFQVEEEID